MAKKKVSPQSKDTKEQQQLQPQQQQALQNQDPDQKTESFHAPMEDPAEKLQKLKNLNAMLLKETFERRQQVESLEQAKNALETELTQSKIEKRELESELDRASYESVELEIFCVFLETQLKEMFDGFEREKREREVEIGYLRSEVNVLRSEVENERETSSRVRKEMDMIKSEVDFQVGEVNGLKVKLIDAEKKERNFEDEILRLRKECEGLVEIRREKEGVIEAVKTEKDLVERNWKEMEMLVEDLKREIDQIKSDKKGIESEKSEQKVKICELEKELGTLNEIVLNLRKEEGALRVQVMELEKNCAEAMEREKKIELKLNAFEGDNRGKQRTIERLEQEKNGVEKLLEVAEKGLKEREKQVEELIRVKDEIEGMKLRQESEIVLMQKELSDLKDSVFELQETCKDKEEKNKELASDINQYKDAFERVTLERDNAQKGFDEEKKNGMKLMSEVSEMEKRILESMEALAHIRDDYDKVRGTKKDLESRVMLLVEEKEKVQKSLVEAKHDIGDLRAKLESVGINSEQALTMLKNTAAMICQSKEDSDGKELVANEKELEGKFEPYAAELEAIKSAFRSKDATVEDMKRQVESMKSSLAEAEAQKKKSSWTCMLTSLTSAALFAAASVAYVARPR